MNSILSQTDTRTKLRDIPRIKLRSRGRTYYRNANPLITEIDGKGEIVNLRSRGVAYRKQIVSRIYKQPSADAINWRWRAALNQQ